jgi:hypothetical protein
MKLCLSVQNKSKLNFNSTVNTRGQELRLKCLGYKLSLFVQRDAARRMEDSYKQITDTLCIQAQDQYWIFVKRFLKQLHEVQPSKQRANGAIAIQHSDWRKFMSSHINTACGVTLNVVECLDETGRTYIMQWNAMKYSSDVQCSKDTSTHWCLSRAIRIDLYTDYTLLLQDQCWWLWFRCCGFVLFQSRI